MSPPRGYSPNRILKACAACGECLYARSQEAMYKRSFTCQARTADVSAGYPSKCWLFQYAESSDTKEALRAISHVTQRHSRKDLETAERRAEVLMAYVREIHSGEPSLAWYRKQLARHTAQIVNAALAPLPYWHTEHLKFFSLKSIAPIDGCVDRVRERSNDHLADLLAGYIEYHYELMQFGFDNGLYGKSNPVKFSTLHQRVYKIANYLEWVFAEGHETLQHAGRMVFDEYMTEKAVHPSAAYQLSRFYDWVRKTQRFVPRIRYNRRGKGKHRDEFPVLKLGESQEAYARIIEHPESQGRALALLALLYAQRTEDSIALKQSDLQRDVDSGLWKIERPGTEPFVVEPELSNALDQCIALAQEHVRRIGTKETEYIFPGRNRGHLGAEVASQRIVRASGHSANILRRTAIVNIYRGGQKTMGTVVLRDILGVSSPTIHQAIKMTGESVNAPTAIEEAEALRKAFLEADDD